MEKQNPIAIGFLIDGEETCLSGMLRVAGSGLTGG
jgi:hypothetical protein